MNTENKKIIFYDGNCGFCNRSVQFILKNRKHNNLIFSPLQSKFAANTLSEYNVIVDMSTLYVLIDNKILNKSDAAFSLVKDLKWYWKFLMVGKIAPKKLRDRVYVIIAKRRMKISTGYCYIPNEIEKKMFTA